MGGGACEYQDILVMTSLNNEATVLFFRGRWHGDIMIHTRRRSAKQDLDEFLKEVSVLSMIRHENVVLFMGACLEPPNLAVITR